ncbi:phasin family protein [Desulfoscipio geothermicus]|uniref:Polyhydroxyalkanoate synthesis regulator phasin n=1 Tax=Desulfoscipio geothermicus DSM 3669 TaxID=1121426 RepID=A0A1I6EKM4_9FIRM|nr:hypothetical protein [Desulfoscipio geothermicus]SFR18314.1 Polyhydroxyalkanoate synthesis regulator phasin [Desulfoscipio geothermicus DSM 3669]
MQDTLRKMLHAGIGAFSMTREKASQIVNELVQKGQVNQEEAGAFIDDLIKKGEQEREALKQNIKGEVLQTTQNLGLVTREELNQLEARVAALEKTLGKS